ncbi:hypothetical protein BGZ65_000180 [Modicella reniformis]|uniref:Uncharacterized protein n=1 Tax=Modicella reniformis TaxID=1440133 RepID=A0A9P6MJK6_9FUNG|nr:hypothetical protein BGZ65_000180 [Modicella reniformis]
MLFNHSRLDRVHRRQKNERVQKQVQRMQLGMIIPTDIGLEQDGPVDQSVSSLTNIKKIGGLKMVRKGDANVNPEGSVKKWIWEKTLSQVKRISKNKNKDMVKENINAQFMDDDMMGSDDDHDAFLMEELDEIYEQYKERHLERDSKMRVKAKHEDNGEWKNSRGESEGDEGDTMDAMVPQNDDTSDSNTNTDSDSGSKDGNGVALAANGKKSSKNSLLVALYDVGQAELLKKTASDLTIGAKMFFDQDMFKGSVHEDEAEKDDKIQEAEVADDENEQDKED